MTSMHARFRHLAALLAAGALALVEPSAAQVGSPAGQRDSTPAASRPTYGPQGLLLNPGARVRASLADGRKLRGSVLVPFEPGSRHLVVCAEPATRCPSAGDSNAVSVSPSDIQSLDVYGKAHGIGFGLGLAGGGLVGAFRGGTLRDPNTKGMALGMVVGAIAGYVLGSRITTWIPAYPCIHACAVGTYPER